MYGAKTPSSQSFRVSASLALEFGCGKESTLLPGQTRVHAH